MRQILILYSEQQILSENQNFLSNKIENNSGCFVSENVKNPYMYISFSNWRNEIVIDNKDKDDNVVTREEIILAVANQDGAHTSLPCCSVSLGGRDPMRWLPPICI